MILPSERPRGKVAREWYDRAVKAELDLALNRTNVTNMKRELESERDRAATLIRERDQWRADAERVDRMYQRLNAMVAEIRMAIDRNRV